jgi:SRSO17 transposase
MPTVASKPKTAGFTDGEFAAYLAHFDDLFARTDQREWFRLYVRGLVTCPDRKNVEAIATAAGAWTTTRANLAQALQHFITDSPWDHSRVLGRYRERLPAAWKKAGAWVIHDGVLLKKGRNSVGTQRQFARSVGRKVNCQIAVVVGVTGPAGYVPLAARLYLPGYWLREHAALVAKTVPEGSRAHASKSAIALALLDEVRAEGWSADSAALDESYRAGEGVAESLAVHGITTAPGAAEHLAAAAERFEWLKTRLGLEHFEERNWLGWHHHAAAVLTAAGLLFATADELTK